MAFSDFIVTLLFISIPESIAFTFLASQLIGLYHKKMVPRLLRAASVAGVVTSVTYYFALSAQVLTINVIANIFIIPLVFRRILAISYRQAFYLVFWIMAIVSLYQSILMYLNLHIMGQNIADYAYNLQFRILQGWIECTLFGSIAYWMIRKDIRLPKSLRIVGIQQYLVVNSKRSVLVLIILLNILVALELFVFPSVEGSLPVQRIPADLFTGFLAVVLLFLSLLLLSWLGRVLWDETLQAEQRAYAKPFQELKESLASQREEFLRCLQTLQDMAAKGQKGQMEDHLDGLIRELKQQVPLSQISNPVLYVFLQAKIRQGEEEGIRVRADIQDDFLDIPLAPFEMVKVLGRLIDSALEVAREQEEGDREILVEIRREEGKLVIRVCNVGVSFDLSGQESYLSSARALVEKYQGKMELLDRTVEGAIHQVSLPEVARG